MLTVIACIIILAGVFSSGVAIGKASKQKKKLIQGTVPLVELVADFEEFARTLEGGDLSIDADGALKALKAHVEQKLLPPKSETKKEKDKKPYTFEGSDRKDDWCDLRCFEKEMAAASNDKERIVIIQRWMKKYYFTTKRGWQTWCIQQMASSDGRDTLRTLFDEQVR